MLWSKFRIQEVESKKIYFRKYYYKLEVSSNVASYLRDRKTKLTRQHVTDYVTRYRNVNYNYGGSWGYHSGRIESVRFSTSTDIDEIIEIGKILRAREDSIKYTIMDSSIFIFSETEQVVYDIATEIQNTTGRLGFYSAIWKPDSKLINEINSGYEILSKDPGYTHKILLRERLVGAEVKHQIYNYLLSLGDQVKISKSVATILSGKSPYVFACWFRTNDPTLVSFLELISPGIVQKIVPVYVKNK